MWLMSVFNPGILVKLTGQNTLPKLDGGLSGCPTNCRFSCELIIFQNKKKYFRSFPEVLVSSDVRHSKNVTFCNVQARQGSSLPGMPEAGRVGRVSFFLLRGHTCKLTGVPRDHMVFVFVWNEEMRSWDHVGPKGHYFNHRFASKVPIASRFHYEHAQ